MVSDTLFHHRRSINFFDDQKLVPLEVLEEMITLATQAPSSFNLQPWNLVILTSTEDKKRLRPLAWDQPKVTEAPVILMVLADTTGWEEKHPTLEKQWQSALEAGNMVPDQRDWFLDACKSLYGKNEQTALAFAAKNAGFFAMALMYAATHMGLCSHPMDGFDHEAVKKEFNIPEKFWIPLLLAVGHMKPGVEISPPKWRKSLEELIIVP